MYKKIIKYLETIYSSKFDILKFIIKYYIFNLYDAVYNNDLDYIYKVKGIIRFTIIELNKKDLYFNENSLKYNYLVYHIDLFFSTFNFLYLFKIIF